MTNESEIKNQETSSGSDGKEVLENQEPQSSATESTDPSQSSENAESSGEKEPELTEEQKAEQERKELEAELSELTVEDFKFIKESAAKSSEHWDRVLRLSAEFENFKKRVARERLDAIRYANESMLERLIPVMDTFEMALMAVKSADAGSIDSLKMGVEMIANQLKTTLSDEGLEEINAENQMFDPKIHEAVSKEARDDVEEGRVLSQTRKGYKLKDRLLRPSSVIVAVSPESPTEGEETDVGSESSDSIESGEAKS